MSQQLAVLKSFAEDDFTKELNKPCKLVGESGLYAIAEVGEHGTMAPITQHYDAKTLSMVCVDYLRAIRLQKAKNDKYVIYSPNESAINSGCGFWSNRDGWVNFGNATFYTDDEAQRFNLPVATGNDAVWLLWEEVNKHYGEGNSISSEGIVTRDDICLHSENIGVASRSIEVCKQYHSADLSNDKFSTVFVYNHEGQYYRVFEEIQDMLANDSEKAIAEFETEEELEAFLNPALTKVSDEYVPPQPVTWEYQDNMTKVAVGRWDSARYIGPVARGAYCEILLLEDNSTKNVYFSFCKQSANEENDADCFGVPDQDVYFYAEGGVAEMNMLKIEGNGEFIVLDYQIAYVSDDAAEAFDFEIEVTDQRATNGQLFVDVGVVEGNIDDILSATFDIDKLPGTEISTQAMSLNFDCDVPAVKIFKKGDSYIIRPEHNVTIKPVQLHNGSIGYVLE
jgi:hypothetical protein